MKLSTQRRLNQINIAFYRATAGEFDATRQRAWPGWLRLLQAIDSPVESVLDIGCGNGRFGLFLAERQRDQFSYCGIDNNAQLLTIARRQMALQQHAQSELIEHDLISDGVPGRQAQLVLLFGVLHHVPGFQQRLQLMSSLANCLLPGGYLALAAWRFYDFERFRRRIMPWPDDIEVEQHDYLLDWRRGERALRYCHFVDDAEHDALLEATGLTVIDDYRADGAEGTLNRYTILRKMEAERE